MLAAAGRMSFNVVPVGSRNQDSSSFEITEFNDTVRGDVFWTRAVKLQIQGAWNSQKLDDRSFISSELERPTCWDVIYFALGPTSKRQQNELLQPLAFSLLGQFVFWMDQHMARLGLEAENYQEFCGKNKFVAVDATSEAMGRCIQWALRENETLINSVINSSLFFALG